MKLLTKEIEKELQKHPFSRNCTKNMPVIVKFFNPYGAGTWLITEAEKQADGDWLMYGYCHIYDWEWGYVSFNELSNIKVNVFGLPMPLERDAYLTPCTKTVAELCEEY